MNNLPCLTYSDSSAVNAISTAIFYPLCPVISLIAIPIFATWTLKCWLDHRRLYQTTLINGSRGQFGRNSFEDYTSWNGLPLGDIKERDLRNGLHVHCSPNPDFNRGRVDLYNPFNDEEAAEWLEKESVRRDAEHRLRHATAFLKLSLKGLIPIIGLIWLGAQLNDPMLDVPLRTNEQWHYKTAINFHKKRALDPSLWQPYIPSP